MTNRQSTILAYVESHIVKYGFAPSVRDIRDACGISSLSVVAYNIRVLIKEGALDYTPGIARSLTLGRRAPMIEDIRGAVGREDG